MIHIDLINLLVSLFKFEHWSQFKDCHVLTVATDNSRGFIFLGKYYSPLVDTIQDRLIEKGKRCISVSRLFSEKIGDKSHGNVLTAEGPFARALLEKKVRNLFGGGAEYQCSKLEEKVWGKILDKTGASKVLAIQPSRELCKACHDRGVWVADLQHGVISDNHPWYGEAYRSKDRAENLPNCFLCWDAASANCLYKWTQSKQIDVRIIGNPWHLRFIQNHESDQLVQMELAKYKNRWSVPRKKILVSLSWGMYGCEPRVPNGFIPNELEKAILETCDEYIWLLRLHPTQISGFAANELPLFKRYFEKTFGLTSAVDWKFCTEAPLPLLLSIIDLHITWSSSTVIEASAWGIRSAILDPEISDTGSLCHYYSHERHSGMADSVSLCSNEIKKWINQSIKRGKSTAREAGERLAAYEEFLLELSK